MSRTDDLRNSGALERGGGGGAPFIRWPESYAYVEGRVLNLWESKFGMSATIQVSDHSSGLECGGKDEYGQKFTKPLRQSMEVNVGLNYATLEGTIQKDDVGKHMHFAFEGWGESRTGDRYREFAVLEVPERGEEYQPSQEPAEDYAPTNDDGIPF